MRCKYKIVNKLLVELVGIEPTTSSLRTMASAELSHSLACTWQSSTVHYGPIQNVHGVLGVCLSETLSARFALWDVGLKFPRQVFDGIAYRLEFRDAKFQEGFFYGRDAAKVPA